MKIYSAVSRFFWECGPIWRPGFDYRYDTDFLEFYFPGFAPSGRLTLSFFFWALYYAVTGVADGWLTGWSQENSVPECANYKEQWANIDLKCPLKAAAGNNCRFKNNICEQYLILVKVGPFFHTAEILIKKIAYLIWTLESS